MGWPADVENRLGKPDMERGIMSVWRVIPSIPFPWEALSSQRGEIPFWLLILPCVPAIVVLLRIPRRDSLGGRKQRCETNRTAFGSWKLGRFKWAK